MPFNIHDENRIKYVSALKEAQVTGDYAKLVSYFAEEQNEYAKQRERFGIYDRYKEYLLNKLR